MGKTFLIIDDSALMRRVISDIIKENYDDVEALDTAVNGLEGFDKLVSKPGYYDLVILDINMPKMNGLELLEMLQKNRMNETVVVVSTVARESAAETIRALELGAIDFLKKPENFYEVKGEGFKTKLLKLIEVVTGRYLNKKNLIPHKKNSAPVIIPAKNHVEAQPAGIIRSSNSKNHTRIVAIACSTGGPKSLQQVIPFLDERLDAPVVLVQHMPKGFTLSLARRLNMLSKVNVKEASDGDVLEKGCVYIAPGGMHIRVRYEHGSHVIRFYDGPSIDGLKPCANVMYESLTDSAFDEIVCVVLTGMGADGTKGIEALKKSGKNTYVISQDEMSCVVYGMPRSIYEAGMSDEVKSLSKIAESINKKVGVR